MAINQMLESEMDALPFYRRCALLFYGALSTGLLGSR